MAVRPSSVSPSWLVNCTAKLVGEFRIVAVLPVLIVLLIGVWRGSVVPGIPEPVLPTRDWTGSKNILGEGVSEGKLSVILVLLRKDDDAPVNAFDFEDVHFDNSIGTFLFIASVTMTYALIAL